MIEIGVFG